MKCSVCQETEGMTTIYMRENRNGSKKRVWVKIGELCYQCRERLKFCIVEAKLKKAEAVRE